MGGYTPGPWYPYKNTAGGWEVMTLRDADFLTGEPRGFIGSECGASICMGIGDHTESRTRGNEAENARLIASAPELLEALQKVEAHLSAIGTPRDAHGRYHKDGEWTFAEALPRDVDAREVKSAFEVVRAAISRATGEGE